YLELLPSGEALAQIIDLPGCYAYGASPEVARMALTAALPAYYDWLRRHDEETPFVTEPHAVAMREVVRVPPRAFVTPDAVPMDRGDLDLGTVLLQWAYEDLSALVADMSDAVLAAHPAGSSAPADRLESLLYLQLWLLSRLDERPVPGRLEALPGGPRTR